MSGGVSDLSACRRRAGCQRVDEIPRLKTVADGYHGDARLAVISLDIDARREKAERFVRGSGMNWPQGFLGGGWADPVTRAYGANAIPAIFLVSPERKVVARDLRGAELDAAVAAALSVR